MSLITTGVGVVGIAGYKRSGKDTFCSALNGNFSKVARLAIADEIKRELAKFLGVTLMRIEKYKEPYYRKPLQDLGTARRRIDENYWLTKLCDQIQDALDCGAHIVVPDVRMPLEAQRLRERFGAKIVRLHREDQGEIDDDDTERFVDSVEVDETYSCGSPEEVSKRAQEFGADVLGWELR